MTVSVEHLTLVLGHQGGWDEIGIVLAPVALFAVLLAITNRRANRFEAEAEAIEQPPPDEPTPR